MSFSPEEVIFEEDKYDYDNSLYIIQKGLVKILFKDTNLGEFGPGTSIGQLSLFSS